MVWEHRVSDAAVGIWGVPKTSDLDSLPQLEMPLGKAVEYLEGGALLE